MTFSSCWSSIHHPRLMITAKPGRDAISHISTMFYKFRKTPLAKLNSIIENSIPFPHFHWILVAYGEKSVFYGRAGKKLSIALAQKLSQKMQTVKVWRDSGQKTGIFHNICNCLKNKKKAGRRRKDASFASSFIKFWAGGRDGDLWMSDWRTHSDFWLQLSSAHVMIERGGGVLVLRGQGSWARLCVWPPGSNVTLSQLQFAEYITAQKTVITLRDGDYTIMQTGCTDLGYYLMTLAIMIQRWLKFFPTLSSLLHSQIPQKHHGAARASQV